MTFSLFSERFYFQIGPNLAFSIWWLEQSLFFFIIHVIFPAVFLYKCKVSPIAIMGFKGFIFAS